MPIKYFKPNIMIKTRCEHCGAEQMETLARLYSQERLVCLACGGEHTPDRQEFRKTVEETEALVDKLTTWPWEGRTD